MWKQIFFFVAFPIIVIGNVNAFVMVDGTEMDPPPYVPYDHLRVRTKVRENKVSHGLLSTFPHKSQP